MHRPFVWHLALQWQHESSPIGKHENPVMFTGLAEIFRKPPQIACTCIRLQKEMTIQNKIRRAPSFSCQKNIFLPCRWPVCSRKAFPRHNLHWSHIEDSRIGICYLRKLPYGCLHRQPTCQAIFHSNVHSYRWM